MSVFNARSNVDLKSREKNSSRAAINNVAEFREWRDGMEFAGLSQNCENQGKRKSVKSGNFAKFYEKLKFLDLKKFSI